MGNVPACTGLGLRVSHGRRELGHWDVQFQDLGLGVIRS